MAHDDVKYIPRTKRGLELIILGFLIHLVAIVLFMIGMLLSLNGESSLNYVRYSNGAFILFITCMPIFLFGFGYMFLWSGEFGTKQTYRVYLASISMMVAFLILFIYILVLSRNFSDIFIAGSDMESRYTYYSYIFGLRDILLFFFHLFISLMWVFLVFELTPNHQRRVLYLYFLISISIYLVAAFVTYLYHSDGTNLKYLIESSSIGGSMILLYCYGSIYIRIRKGEIIPVPAASEFPPYFPFRYLNPNS
jgi:hypothetical protein